MYVCVCNGVTDKDIQRAVDAGCTSLSELTMRTGAGATCGSCIPLAMSMMDNMVAAAKAIDLPVLVLENERATPLHAAA